MAQTFDPYRTWLGIPPQEQPPNHYRLLGVGPFEAEPDVISNAADRQMAHVRMYQSGKLSKISQRILNELSIARVTLLDPRKKAAYDEELHEELASQGPPPAPGSIHPDVLTGGPNEVPSEAEVLSFPGKVKTVRRPGSRRPIRKRSNTGPLITIVLIVVILIVVLIAILSNSPRRGGAKSGGERHRHVHSASTEPSVGALCGSGSRDTDGPNARCVEPA